MFGPRWWSGRTRGGLGAWGSIGAAPHRAGGRRGPPRCPSPREGWEMRAAGTSPPVHRAGADVASGAVGPGDRRPDRLAPGEGAALRKGVRGERTKPPVPGRRPGRGISTRPGHRVHSDRETIRPSNDPPAEHDGSPGQGTTPRERIAHRIELRRSDMMLTNNYIPRESLIERC